MAMLSITPIRRVKATSTTLAENLELPKLNLTETILSAVDEPNRESTQKYLEALGVNQLNKEFNELIKQYETDYALQTLEIQHQAALQEQDTIRQAGEGILGSLGTGAAADLTSDIQQSVSDLAAMEHQELTQYYSELIQQADEYKTETSKVLLEQVNEYNQNADLLGLALLEEIARNAGLEYSSNTELESVLQTSGFIKQVGDSTVFTVTAKGQAQIAKILQSLDKQYGDPSERINRLIADMTEIVMSKQYPSLNPDSETYQTKVAQLNEQFDAWLQQNSTILYYTDLGLATFEAGQIVVTSLPDVEISDEASKFITSEGIDVYAIERTTDNYIELFGKFAGSNNSTSKQTQYIESILNDARDGNIPDGSFFTVNYGADVTGDVGDLFYYENGRIYRTPYSLEHLPSVVASSMFYAPEGYSIDRGKVDGYQGIKAENNDGGWTSYSFEDFFKALDNGKLQAGQYVKIYDQEYYVQSDGTLKKHIHGLSGIR